MRRANRILLVWLIALLSAIAASSCAERFESWTGRSLVPLEVTAHLAQLVLIALTFYLLVLAARFLLRKLFWRVGRRLALSYVLIGLLPFLFFAVLVLVIGYLTAGVLSQTILKMERTIALERLDQWNVSYALSGVIPDEALGSLEVFDSASASGSPMPEWLEGRNFRGLARRGATPLFVSSRAYQSGEDVRTIALVQPLDAAWRDDLFRRSGMLSEAAIARTEERRGGLTIDVQEDDREGSEPGRRADRDEPFERFFVSGFRQGGVIWGDISPPLQDWRTGTLLEHTRVFTMISNPWRNLLDFYMGDSQYATWLGMIIASVVVSLGVIYLLAALLASWLIFSISRAVNRIEKASRAVERGDFSHRIAMRPTSQIGDVAQSFDRMTASVGSLLSTVAEKERLQSEIDIAASIQRNLLPTAGPAFPGISFAAHFEPSAAIGGDYYDVFNLDRSRLAVAIGDVSGHGLSTGLVMAMVKAAITTLVEEGADEASLFLRLNDLVRRSTDRRTFMTLAFTIFDLEQGTIRHTSAGHLYPYLLRSDQPLHQIEAPALPLGLRESIHPATIELPLRNGDRIVYLSDGIIEAQNPDGEPFGFERLEQILDGAGAGAPEQLRNAILAAVSHHSAGRSPDDDRTIMILGFES